MVHRVLLCGPFVIGDLVLTRRPQTPKGQSPYAVIEVVSRYTYWLSDGQKWNCRRLKQYLPSPMEWTELVPQLLNQPQGGVGVADAEEDVTMGPEIEEVALPGTAIIVPHQDAEAEPQYPACDRCLPDRLTIVMPLPQKRRRKK